MNLTGARTSHQMGKEIGYERWPAIKSDIPQCHLSDSGRGIMATANESWAPVRRRFKSAPRSGRLALLTQCLVLCPTPAQLCATDQKRGKPFTFSQTVSRMNEGSGALCQGPESGLQLPGTSKVCSATRQPFIEQCRLLLSLRLQLGPSSWWTVSLSRPAAQRGESTSCPRWNMKSDGCQVHTFLFPPCVQFFQMDFSSRCTGNFCSLIPA